MEQSDTIAYKTWVENLREPAPEGAWGAVADQLDIDAAWDNISESLDLDAVWQNIDAGLPHTVTVSTPTQTHFPKLFWVAAALVLLTLTTPLSETDPQPIKQSSAESAKAEGQATQTEQDATSATVNTDRKSGTEKSNSRISDQKTEVSSQVKANDSTPLVTESSVVPNTGIAKASQQSFPEIVSIKNEATAQVQLPDTLAAPIKTDSVTKLAEVYPMKDSVLREQFERAKWQIGIIGTLKNTWLINPETANGLKRTSLNDTRLTFGKEFGITLQRSVGASSAVQFEYYFYSEIGQRYHEYINALYQTKDVKLQYQKFQLIYRQRIWKNFNGPALYAVGGIRVSRLTLADTSIGDENQIVTQEYRPWDYGFILGGEAEFMLNRKLILVSGLRLSYGLRNIYLGNGQAPAEFNKTHTASAGLALGLKYKIN